MFSRRFTRNPKSKIRNPRWNRYRPLIELLEDRCVPAALPPDGLVSWYRAEDNATDFADGNTGTLTNGATFAAGQVGQAFSFDGVDDFVDVPDAANLDFGSNEPMTIELWAFRTDTSPIQHLIGKRVSCAGGDDFN